MVYAKAHDENVAEDYFAAMARVEARLDLRGGQKKNRGSLNSEQRRELLGLAEKLATPELCENERMTLAGQMQTVLLLKE